MPNSGASTTAHKTWETDRREREKKPKISIHNIRKIETRKPFYSDRLARESDGFNIPTAHIVSLNKKKNGTETQKKPDTETVCREKEQTKKRVDPVGTFFLSHKPKERKNLFCIIFRAGRKKKKTPTTRIVRSKKFLMAPVSFSFLVRFLVSLRDRFISLELLAVGEINKYISKNRIKISSIIGRGGNNRERNGNQSKREK